MPYKQKARESTSTYNWAIPSLQIWLVVDVNNRRQQVLKQKNFKSRYRTSTFSANDLLPWQPDHSKSPFSLTSLQEVNIWCKRQQETLAI